MRTVEPSGLARSTMFASSSAFVIWPGTTMVAVMVWPGVAGRPARSPPEIWMFWLWIALLTSCIDRP